MITTNYSTNNQPTFGSFRLHASAKDILSKKLKTPELLDSFNKLVTKADDLKRDINVSNNGSRLSANVGDGIWKTQGFFQKPLAFLEKMIKRADEVEKKEAFKNSVKDALDRADVLI